MDEIICFTNPCTALVGIPLEVYMNLLYTLVAKKERNNKAMPSIRSTLLFI
jgi:hypothetical protein